jgi:glycosyltransferase involved in cell wall biosynthesis
LRSDTLFLSLNIFSATGGIEKVCRIAGKALFERSLQEQERVMIWSMHDQAGDATGNPYFPTEIFRAYKGRKAAFVKRAVQQGARSRIVILSHINLLSVAWMIKKVSARTRIILFGHGIEIWDTGTAQGRMFAAVDEVWAVSRYTRDRILANQQLPLLKISVLNNCLDPFLPLPKNVPALQEYFSRYGIKPGDKILFALSRLSGKERYKGYDQVIRALKELRWPQIKYILAGKADKEEETRLLALFNESGMAGNIILAGFIDPAELAAHFKMADIYIMPSSKEGFGIVFLEAMYYGLPVIAGNADGSPDALLDGRLGVLTEPTSVSSIKEAIEKVLEQPFAYKPSPELLQQHFSYEQYQQKLNDLLDEKAGQLQPAEFSNLALTNDGA